MGAPRAPAAAALAASVRCGLFQAVQRSIRPAFLERILSDTKGATKRSLSAHSNCCIAPIKLHRRSAPSAEAYTRQKGETAVRRIMGVLSLGKEYGVARMCDACAAALEVRICDDPFVRPYLERNSFTAAELAADRSSHPATHAVSRLNRQQGESAE